MEEKFDRIEKGLGDLTEIVVAIKEYMEANLVIKQELKAEFDSFEKKVDVKLEQIEEKLGSKIEGLQRGLDAQYERHNELENRVSKLEVHV